MGAIPELPENKVKEICKNGPDETIPADNVQQSGINCLINMLLNGTGLLIFLDNMAFKIRKIWLES